MSRRPLLRRGRPIPDWVTPPGSEPVLLRNAPPEPAQTSAFQPSPPVGTGLYGVDATGQTWQYVPPEVIPLAPPGGPFLPVSGGTMTGPLNWTATGATTLRAAQDRSAEVINALDYGVVPNVGDSTAALQAFFAALKPGTIGVLPAGTIHFNQPISIANMGAWTLEGQGAGTTTLLYSGANTTNDILTISGCSYFTVRDFWLDSATPMTAGSGMHICQCSHGFMNDLLIASQNGQTHVGSDGNLHMNLWHGIWFDQIDDITLSVFHAQAQQDAVRVNGTAGPGQKADLSLIGGQIGAAAIGLHCGGGFGGLYVDDTGIIGCWQNVVVDQALVAEGHRELFFGTNVMMDSSGITGTPTAPGAVPVPGQDPDVLYLNDPDGGFIQVKGWVASAVFGGGGHCVRVHQWVGEVNLDGAIIFQATYDGIRVDTAVPIVLVSPSTQIINCNQYGVNATVANARVIASPYMSGNTLGTFGGITPPSLPGSYFIHYNGWFQYLTVSGSGALGTGASWFSGTGAPTSSATAGSLYSRTDGAVGSTLYVSAGGGTWNAVAGV